VPYEVYKLLHIVLVVLFVSGAAVTLYADQPGKFWKIQTGVVSFLIFVAGMGLMARIGVSHTEGWPLWLKGKIAVWLLAAIFAPIAAKRMRGQRHLAMGVLMVLITAAVWLAIYQPMPA
jgi:uncharacterized membrane protein SirB2